MSDNKLQILIDRIIDDWEYVVNGLTVKYEYQELINLISNHAKYPNDVKEILDREKWICMSSDGRWGLTQKAIKRKKFDRILTSEKEDKIQSTAANWKSFKTLLGYYRECAKQQEKVQFYLRPEKNGKDFYIPKYMESGWLQKLGEEKKHHILSFDFATELVMMENLLTDNKVADPVMLGYPLVAYFDQEKNCNFYVPVVTIPLKRIREHEKLKAYQRMNSVEVILDFENARLNHAWFEHCVEPEDQQDVIRAIDRCHEKDEFAGLFDAGALLSLIHQYSIYRESRLDSDNLDQTVPTFSRNGEKRRFCNTVAIFKATGTSYTRNMMRELKYILEASPAELDKTSLAYIFREPPLVYPDKDPIVPIPFINSNIEQLEAVKKALSLPVCQIQGPPGTGKSQVAVNIIANSIFYGKSVLFTSKNHSAINAIKARALSLLGENIPMVQYCIDEGDRVSWFDNDYVCIKNELLKYDISENESFSTRVEGGIQAITQYDKLIEEQTKKDKEFVLKQAEYDKAYYTFDSLSELASLKKEKENIQICELKNYVSTVKKYNRSGIIGFFSRLLIGKKNYKRIISEIEKEYGLLGTYILTDISMFLSESKKLIESYEELQIAEKNISLAYNNYSKDNRIDSLTDNYLKAESMITSENCIPTVLYKWSSQAQGMDENLEKIDQVRAKFHLEPNRIFTENITANEKNIEASIIRNQFKIQPAWVTTLLSLHLASPLYPGIFDQLVIDESYQCDPVSVIPAMFRAKHVAFIGDPKQLKPIVSLSRLKNSIIWKSYFRNNTDLLGYNFVTTTAYDLGKKSKNEIKLKEHFRCSDDIAYFCNQGFYDNLLRVRTREFQRNIPDCLDSREAVIWYDIKDSIDDEISKTIEVFKKIKSSGYNGTIGIICPFSFVAKKIRDELYNNGYNENDVLVNTVYSFQGAERDVIIYTVNYVSALRQGKIWYLISEENRNLYNVAVSRAKACLVIIGDKQRCLLSKSRDLQMLAKMPIHEQIKTQFDSIWEKKLYEALLERGIKTTTQRYFNGYYFDMAYEEPGVVKIDIEVDGRRYHMNLDGSLKQRDIIRNFVAQREGWEVRRFWVFELKNNMKECVDEIERTINYHRNRLKR